MSLGLTPSQKYMLFEPSLWTTYWDGALLVEFEGFEPCFAGGVRFRLLDELKDKALEFWIDYNYEVAQGRKTGCGVFEWENDDDDDYCCEDYTCEGDGVGFGLSAHECDSCLEFPNCKWWAYMGGEGIGDDGGDEVETRCKKCFIKEHRKW